MLSHWLKWELSKLVQLEEWLCPCYSTPDSSTVQGPFAAGHPSLSSCFLSSLNQSLKKKEWDLTGVHIQWATSPKSP